MGPLMHVRNTWKTELFSLEEMCDEEGNCTYYLDNVGIICSGYYGRENNITKLKEHLRKIVAKFDAMTEEEILANIEQNVIEHMQ